MPSLRWNSSAPVSDSSGQVTAPTSPSAVPGISIKLENCPTRKGMTRFDATVTLETGSTPSVNMVVTVEGVAVSRPLSFTRAGGGWRASATVDRDVRENQSIGLSWSCPSAGNTFSDITLSVVATDWGDID